MKHIINLAGAALFNVLVVFLVRFVETQGLQPYVSGFADGVSVDDWLARFSDDATIGVGVAFGTFILWYLYGQFLFSPSARGDSSARPMWILFALPPFLMSLYQSFTMPVISEGRLAVTGLLFLNTLLTFWFVTAMFSPTLVKTAPFLFDLPRKLRDALPW